MFSACIAGAAASLVLWLLEGWWRRRHPRTKELRARLDPHEYEDIGYRMGERGILPGEWDVVWEREVAHAEREAAKMLRQPGDTEVEWEARVQAHNERITSRRG